MGLPTSNLNYDPNAPFDMGANAAGCGRYSNLTAALATIPRGLDTDGVVNGTTLRVGFNAAGMVKTNGGPNVIGAPRSINGG